MKTLFSYTNEQYSATKKGNLSVFLTNQLASFAVLDPQTNQPTKLSYFQIENWSEEAVALFINTCKESAELGSIVVAFATERYTLLPISKFDPKALQQQLHATFPFNPAMEFLQESYTDAQFYLGYQVPSILLHALKHSFPAFQFRHVFKPLFYKVDKQATTGTIVIDIAIQQLSIATFKADQLLYAGTQLFTTEQDALYILLKICHAYLINPLEAQVFISGLVEVDSNLFNVLAQYFNSIQFRENEYDWSNTSLPAHYFTLLTNNLLCVS